MWTDLTLTTSLLNSPIFLAFDLSVIEGTDPGCSITTKVPFTLPSKTFSISTPLEESNSSAARSYHFPYSALSGPSVPREPFTPTHGRSFLQSVFYRINFDTEQSMRAQAPGPANLSGAVDVVTIDPLTRMVSMQDTAVSNT